MATIAPTVTAETLIAYWFAKDTQLDQTLLGALARLRANGMPMHLATVQEDRRAAYLWQTLGLKDRFDSILHSGLIGAAKPDSAYFDAVAQRLNLAPGDLMLLDDRQDNVDAAIGSGWQARLWTGRQTLDEVLFTSV